MGASSRTNFHPSKLKSSRKGGPSLCASCITSSSFFRAVETAAFNGDAGGDAGGRYHIPAEGVCLSNWEWRHSAFCMSICSFHFSKRSARNSSLFSSEVSDFNCNSSSLFSCGGSVGHSGSDQGGSGGTNDGIGDYKAIADTFFLSAGSCRCWRRWWRSAK